MLQLQPTEKDYAQWAALAAREQAAYEMMEFSTPALLDKTAEEYPFCAEARRSGRIRSLHGAFIDVNPASGDSALRSVSQRRCRESCALAVRLGAHSIVFHSGCAPFLRGAYLDNWADVCAEFYQKLARTYHLQIFVENSADLDPAPLAALMRRVEDRRVEVCLDVGHANHSRASLREWFDVLGAHIGYLHLSDNGGRFDDHLPLGAGTVDWTEADALWRGLGREDMPITLETGGVGGVERSLRFLKERRLFGMGE